MILRLLFFCCVFFISSFTFSQKNVPDTRLKDIESLVKEALKIENASGVAIAIIEKNKVVYSGGVGYSNYDLKKPMTANTQLAIGSCTKAFTATLLGQLREEGKLSFNKPVRDYLPALKFYNNELNNHATLKDLMMHATGIPRYDYSWYLFNTHNRDSLMKRVAYFEPAAELRENWIYNNFMYLLQGMVVEAITGKTWEQNIREKIFEPLQITNASLSLQDFIKAADIATGYEGRNDSLVQQMPYYDIKGMAPAGVIYASVNEMAKWVISWINGGKNMEKVVVPTLYLSEAMAPQMVVTSSAPTAKNPEFMFNTYGYGWGATAYKGRYRVSHGGNIDGFSASFNFYPVDSVGIIILTNQNASSLPALLHKIIADRMLKLPVTDWLAKQREMHRKAKEEIKSIEENKKSNVIPGASSSHSLSTFTGAYNNNAYGVLKVRLETDSLMMYTTGLKFYLKHLHYNYFKIHSYDVNNKLDTTGENVFMVQFLVDPSGEINKLELLIPDGTKTPEFTRVPESINIDEEGLEKYEGIYELAPGAEAKIYIKNNVLYCFIEGQPEYELIATDTHKFSIKILTGFHLVFEENEDGKITGLTFNQPNGKFKAKKKH